MSKAFSLGCSLLLVVLSAVMVPSARADSFTYSFDYTGVGIGTAQGSGQFTYDSVTRDVTAFTFTDTFYNVFGQNAGSFTYSLADISYQGLLLFANGTLAGIDITTIYKNAVSGNHGQANFSFNYAVGLGADATTGTRLAENTVGSGNVRLKSIVPAATPEPSSLMLLGTGMLAVAGAARKKYYAFKTA